MKRKIGVLLPFSGEFLNLRKVLLNPLLQSFSEDDIVKEFIHQGQQKEVERAFDKLFYNDDVDVIVGYIGYRVATSMFDRLWKNSDKLFIHISLGEIIPYTHSKVGYPPNYRLISADAWSSIAFLGMYVGEDLSAANAMICTSLYDTGYSLVESFRIGYHWVAKKDLQLCTLRNEPGNTDITALYDEINRIKPEHIHVTLCGKELTQFINQYSSFVDYIPSLSFAFPVPFQFIERTKLQFEKVYMALPENMLPVDMQELVNDPFTALFTKLMERTVKLIESEAEENQSRGIVLLETDMAKGQIYATSKRGTLPKQMNSAFNYSAEQTVSVWQNPYLCI